MTIDPEAHEPAPASDPTHPSDDRGAAQRLWPVALTAGVVAGAVVAGLIVVAVRGSSPPPGVPTQVGAVASVCAPPTCDEIGTAVRVTWSPGAGTVGTRVLRDGVDLSGTLPPDATSFIDASAPLGVTVAYTVVADGRDGSVAAVPVRVSVPTPPVTAAALSGRYLVHLTVRHARNIAELFGVTDPVPGAEGRVRWTFTTTCPPAQGACPTRWGRSTGLLRQRDGIWLGVVGGPPARCQDGGAVTAPVRFRLRPVSGTVDGGWWVRRFEGTASVRFACPGVAPSRGRASVIGIRR